MLLIKYMIYLPIHITLAEDIVNLRQKFALSFPCGLNII